MIGDSENVFSDEEEDDSASPPFFFDPDRSVMVVKVAGSTLEIPMTVENMTSLVKNAAQVIKTNDINPTIKEQQGRRGLSAVDIALYKPDDDALANNTLASTFLNELLPSSDKESRKNTTAKKAAIIHSMYKLSNPRFQSSQQLHLSDQLRCDKASNRNMETLSKFGVGTARKSIQKLLFVDHGTDHELLYERLLAEQDYGKKVIACGADNLQWAKGGQYCHTITGFVMILDLEELNGAYADHFETTNYTRLIERGNATNITEVDISQQSDTSLSAITAPLSGHTSMTVNTNNNSPGVLATTVEESIKFDLESLNKSFPDLDSFQGLIPMLTTADANLMYQLLADQVFARFCSVVKIMVDVPDVFEDAANISATIDSAPRVKGEKLVRKKSKGPDMQATQDSDDEVIMHKDGDVVNDPVGKNHDCKTSQRLLSTSKQTVFDNMYGSLHMLPPVSMNFSTLYGSCAHPISVIKQFGIGPGNNPEGTDEKENMAKLIVAGDGAPAKAHLNMILTTNEKLHSKLLNCKAHLHVIFSSLGAFHVNCKFVKDVMTFYSSFLKNCLTRMGRKTEGQQNYTLGFGRFDDSFIHIWCLQDAICVSAIRSFVKWQHTQVTGTSSPPVAAFGDWLIRCNSKGRTALMFMIHMEPFYLMNYAVRANEMDLYVASLLLTLELDHAWGDIEYATLKAYFVLRLVMLSEYWREIFAHFFFSANLNEKGVCLDLLCEYIHKNVKSRIPVIGQTKTFFQRLEAIELSLPDSVRTMTAHHNPTGYTPSLIKPLNMQVILQSKEVNMQKVLLLASDFEANGMWDIERTSSPDNISSKEMMCFESSDSPEIPVFSSTDAKESYSGSMGTLFETGREIGHIVLEGLSDAVIIGAKECEELWNKKLRGELPDENDDDDDDDNDNDEEDEIGKQQNESGVEGAVSVNARETTVTSTDLAPLSSNSTQAATTRTKLALKTKPSWKAGNSNHLIVGNMKGCRKKITQMDTAILKLLSVPRTMTSSSIENDNSEETVTLILDDSTTTSVTKEMFLVLIRYYYSILRFLLLGDASHIPTFLDSDHFQLSDIRSHVEELQRNGATAGEEQCFSTIERILAMKSPPSKKQIVQGFVKLRLMLTSTIDSIITTIARTTLEESEKCINVGTVETCWLPWAERLQKPSAYIRRMETESNVDANMMEINESFDILYRNYQSHVQNKSCTDEESLISKIIDCKIDRKKVNHKSSI